jgi:hypothetical protein
VQISTNFIGFQDDKINNEKLIDEPQIAINQLTDIFTGSGVNQDVRIFGNNKSENLLNNEGYFEIPSIPTEDMFLVHGDFNVTFQNNFTTDYIIEDDDALYAEDFVSFNYDTASSGFTWDAPDTERLTGSFNDLIDNSNSTYVVLNATQGLLNFTMSADFTGTSHNFGGITGSAQFNRSRILALISSLVVRVFAEANLTVRVKDYSQSSWIDVITGVPIGLDRQTFRNRFINENLNFIDLSDICFIQFLFERYDNNPFIARLFEYDIESTYAFDLPITNQEYVALEFDLKGEESAVHGFHAWIRTLDLVEAATTQLNISLYRANRTVVRTGGNLRNIDLGPNYSEMIESVIVNSFTGDSLSYFEIDSINTANLNLYNYFIVIKSNNPKEVYSIVTLPYFDFGDDLKTEHQLKTTQDSGNSWKNAKKVILTTNQPYVSGQLDASSFTLNVTRGYMPSDFVINNNYTLRIQDIPLNNLEISSAPYNESSYLTWGLGRWKNDFPTPIEDPVNVFRVNLKWNKTLIKGFKFNVSYSVNAYWVENASSTYRATYNNYPEWVFHYYYDKNNPLFTDWPFLEFWYLFSDYFSAINVTDPNNEEILPIDSGQSPLSENPSKYKVIVQDNLATQTGYYRLNLTSYNFIHKMHSYINYQGKLWESNGFMNGDNISISVDIQDHNKNPPKSGDVNAILFYPDGTKFRELNYSFGFIDGSILSYDFNNQTMLDVTNALTIYGKYHLGFFWFNGSAIGCKEIIIYIDIYDVVLYDCEYNSIIKKNILNGEILNKVFHNYTMLIASINETTGISMPNFYPINNTNLDSVFSYEIGGQELSLLMTSFKQNENILNPGETVNIKMELQNLHPFIPVNVKIEVKLISYINEDWVIAKKESNTVLLYFSGHPNESNEFSVNLTIPDLDEVTKIWPGFNAPIRLGGAKTIVNIYIDDPVNVGVFESMDYSLLSNKTSNNFDGYILGMRVAEETTSRSILYDFNRDECIYIPNNTKFLVNIIDRNYISSYNQFTNEFSLRLNSKFTNIIINPINPIKGQSFNISSNLTTEFGEKLINKNVTCQYYSAGQWVLVGSDFTDLNGFTTFQIDTITIDFEEELLVRLSWDGDSINGVIKDYTVGFIIERNNISIVIIPNDVLIFRNRDTTVTVIINNIGDSNLRITNISIEFNHVLSYSMVQVDYLMLEHLAPREHTKLIFEIGVLDFKRLEISVSITAQNILTNKSIIGSQEASFKVYELPIYEYFIQYFMFFIGTVFVLIWLIALIYARKTRKKLEIPIEEVKKKPRREKGRYVPVSELKKPTPIKKISKKKEEPKKVIEKEKVDLDSLLEERGLADKKKKSEK